jgi:hypothetical protein
VVSIWKRDLRNLVRRRPKLTLAVNLLALPVTALWVWAALAFDFSSPVFLTGLLSWFAISIYFAWLMVDTFEEGTWIIIFFELLGIYFWVSALIKLIRVVQGKTDFPPLQS